MRRIPCYWERLFRDKLTQIKAIALKSCSIAQCCHMKNCCWLSYLTSPGEILPISAQFANVAADGLELARCYYDSLSTSSFSFLEMFSMQTMNEVEINIGFYFGTQK
jgi:hypothetical protein